MAMVCPRTVMMDYENSLSNLRPRGLCKVTIGDVFTILIPTVARATRRWCQAITLPLDMRCPNVGIEEGLKFMATVESHLEEVTPCQTPTSSCLTKAHRNANFGRDMCGTVGNFRKGTCEEVNALRRQIGAVIERYPEFILAETLRSFLGTVVGGECNSVLAHGRQLDNNPCKFQDGQGRYTFDSNCYLSKQVQVPKKEKWTIEGSDNPKVFAKVNGRHFQVEGELVVSGVTFINGKNTGRGGGAIIIKRGGAGIFTDCHFTANEATKVGGAVYVENGGAGTFTDCLFTANDAKYGGAVYVDYGGAGTFTGCIFAFNEATEATEGGSGGAIIIKRGGAGTFTDCHFNANEATSGGGGAVYVDNGGAGTFTGCVFDLNKATKGGGAVKIYNGTGEFTDCVFTSNSATEDGKSVGGAVYVKHAAGKFTNSRFTKNTAWYGGAVNIDIPGSQGTFQKCLFNSNEASGDTEDYGLDDTRGGAVYITGGNGTFTDCNFTSNAAKGVNSNIKGQCGGAYVTGNGFLEFRLNYFFQNNTEGPFNSPTSSSHVVNAGGNVLFTCLPGDALAPALQAHIAMPQEMTVPRNVISVMPDFTPRLSEQWTAYDAFRGDKGTSCKECPTGSVSVEGAPGCVSANCQPGVEYLVKRNNSKLTAVWSCEPCPAGAVCRKDAQWQEVMAKTGYWRVPGPAPQKFERCIEKSACMGADPLKRLNATEGCRVHYTGPLCGHCASGATISGFGRTCSRCPSKTASTVQVIVGILIVVLAAIYIIYDGIVGASEIESTGILPFHTLCIRTVVSYLQVASMLSLYNLTFPDFVSSMIAGQAAVSSPGEVITNIDCIVTIETPLELFTAKQVIIFSAPLILCVFLGTFFGVRSLLHQTSSGFDQFIGSCLIGLNLMYPTLVKRAALIFTCRTIGKAHFLDQALNVECYQRAHIPLIVCIGVPSILLYIIGFPCSLLMLLRRLTHNGALDPMHEAYNRRWVVRLGFLYAGYEKKHAYWEAFVLLRKAFLSGFAVFLADRSAALQVVVALLILFLCHYAQVTAEPLEHDWHDLMESRSLAASLLILFTCAIGDAISNNSGTLSNGVSIAVTSAVLIVTCVFLATTIRFILFAMVLERDIEKDGPTPKFVVFSKFLLRTCCGERKDEDEWEKERQSFFERSASGKGNGSFHSNTKSKAGTLEMIENAVWKSNRNIGNGTKTDQEPIFKAYTDPATGRLYHYDPNTRSTRWITTYS
eukprot:g5346.t1